MTDKLPMGTPEAYDRAVAALPRTIELAAEPNAWFYREQVATTLVGMATYNTVKLMQLWGWAR